jgi:alkylation response protein AidB-like acyl-CoA dehydrogenase
MLGKTFDASAALLAAFDCATAASCAAAVGVMQFLLDSTLSYTRGRKQFGNAIASFQVVSIEWQTCAYYWKKPAV